MTGHNSLPAFAGNVPSTLVDRRFAEYNAAQAFIAEQEAVRRQAWEKAQAASGSIALLGSESLVPQQRGPVAAESFSPAE